MEKFVHVVSVGEGKCGSCNFNSSLYRLSDEDESLKALCGACFSEWAANGKLAVRRTEDM